VLPTVSCSKTVL